jgi:hypothetical protein
MAISTSYISTAVFIGGSRTDDSAVDAPLRGTGFVAQMEAPDPDQCFLYVITAAHVVRPLARSFVRLSRHDGTTVDMPLNEWTFHYREDVAVTPIALDPGEIRLTVVPVEMFVGVAETQFAPGPGDEVFFSGLLGDVPSMGQANVPMVRGGMIGALHQDGIPMRVQDGTVLSAHGHLIDCRSFGGFSGSPCFARFVSRIDATPNLGLKVPKETALLLGIVGGHFDLHASVALPDQEDRLRVSVTAGIAVLQTSETILDVLRDDDLEADRLS